MPADLKGGRTIPVAVPIGEALLDGDLGIPANLDGIVVFAHGSGSSRRSPRNRFVASALERRHLGTLLVDLLTPSEAAVDDRTAEYRFDVPMLAARLGRVISWVRDREETAAQKVGLFGASTGAGAALIAAAERPHDVSAVVSRGGRPDLAGRFLQRVAAPTLLIVGGLDGAVIQMNREAMAHMPGMVGLEIVPGATHLFEESGALERVADLAGDWFTRHLQTPSRLSRSGRQ
jgi:dienelactone hydrolase